MLPVTCSLGLQSALGASISVRLTLPITVAPSSGAAEDMPQPGCVCFLEKGKITLIWEVSTKCCKWEDLKIHRRYK